MASKRKKLVKKLERLKVHVEVELEAHTTDKSNDYCIGFDEGFKSAYEDLNIKLEHILNSQKD